MQQLCKQQIDQLHTQIKEYLSAYHHAISANTISENEFWIWQTLTEQDGEYTQQDLCTIWSLPKQTVNSIVAQMIIKKYARLEHKPGQRKRKIIRLTEEGKKRGLSIIAPIAEAEQKAFMKMTAEQFSAMTQSFGQYLAIIKNEFEAQANA
ncbi:MAG: MarR family transcriptional regulator [Clostridia bacterium]|nr:MarR family transcriptional regulator [Clostridia bacterium]